MKNHIEIVRIEHYHSIILNNKLIVQESSDDLAQDLQDVFAVMPEGAVSMTNICFNDDEVDEFYAYVAEHSC